MSFRDAKLAGDHSFYLIKMLLRVKFFSSC